MLRGELRNAPPAGLLAVAGKLAVDAGGCLRAHGAEAQKAGVDVEGDGRLADPGAIARFCELSSHWHLT